MTTERSGARGEPERVPPGPSNLYDFEKKIVEVLDEMSDLIPDVEGQVSEEDVAKHEALKAQLDSLLSRESSKVDAIASVIERFAITSEECAQEAKRLVGRARSFESKRARLARYVLDVMLRWGAKRLEGTMHTLTRIQNVDTVEVEPGAVESLPPEFQRVTVTIIPTSAVEIDRALALRDEFQNVKATIEPDKVALKKRIAAVEGFLASDLGVTSGPRHAETDDPNSPMRVPFGVELRPGTWRLAVK